MGPLLPLATVFVTVLWSMAWMWNVLRYEWARLAQEITRFCMIVIGAWLFDMVCVGSGVYCTATGWRHNSPGKTCLRQGQARFAGRADDTARHRYSHRDVMLSAATKWSMPVTSMSDVCSLTVKAIVKDKRHPESTGLMTSSMRPVWARYAPSWHALAETLSELVSA